MKDLIRDLFLENFNEPENFNDLQTYFKSLIQMAVLFPQSLFRSGLISFAPSYRNSFRSPAAHDIILTPKLTLKDA